ncbi:MAG: hypothetical protein ACWA5A_07600 [Marinibacterium sp.]
MKLPLTALCATALLAGPALASGDHAKHQDGAIQSPTNAQAQPEFDIVAAHVHHAGTTVTFHMSLAGPAGAQTPDATGALAGAPVWSYVWPTTLDPATVGFEAGSGILAMAATSHPDFDDTPLYDENADGNRANDGKTWHSHWVVLAPAEACGPGALAVKDIPDGAEVALPATWPGLPLMIGSPGFTPVFDGEEITVEAALAPGARGALEGAGYDGVTAALRVNQQVHAPLLCVTDVFDVASGDLSLPGRVK